VAHDVFISYARRTSAAAATAPLAALGQAEVDAFLDVTEESLVVIDARSDNKPSASKAQRRVPTPPRLTRVQRRH
jgi:hypothetical protein